jgi:hypothetical protein
MLLETKGRKRERERENKGEESEEGVDFRQVMI